MTCIAGMIQGGEVWIGCDSWTGSEGSYFARKDPKLFRHSGMLIGFAGNFRVAQIINHCLPDLEGMNCPADIIQRWIPAVRAALAEHGALKDESGAADFGGAMMLGIAGRLFEFGGDFALHELEKYGAVGTGEDLANGALFFAEKNLVEINGFNVVMMALRAASSHCSSVCAPFHIQKL